MQIAFVLYSMIMHLALGGIGFLLGFLLSLGRFSTYLDYYQSFMAFSYASLESSGLTYFMGLFSSPFGL